MLTYSIIGVFVLGADDSILTNTLLSKLWSAFEWFGYSMPYFCLRYPGDRRQFYEEQEQKNGQTADSRHNGSVIVSVLSSQV
ncbi:hypothetical protein EON65_12860 [archaeon]|nr:MAG: hypothetical protein EON65_12860 [archaeon]